MSSIVDYLFGTGGFAPNGYCLSWHDDLECKWLLGLFAAFITLCGLTHLGALVTQWAPYYGVEGIIKLATALVSVAAAMICWPLIPRLLALPCPIELRRGRGAFGGGTGASLAIVHDRARPDPAGGDGRPPLPQAGQGRRQPASIPIVVLTTSDDPTDFEACYRNGANSYIT